MKGISLRLPALYLIVATSGCGTFTRPYPEKSLHVISVGEQGSASGAAARHGSAVLRMNAVRIARPYDGTTFVYKTGPTSFATDYYNGFVAPPDRLLEGETMRWLEGSGLFASVIDGTSAADYQFTLETNVTALYGDYSQKGHPAAVIEAKFFLIDERGGRYRIAFQKSYQASEPAGGTEPEKLSAALGAAYRRILTSLATDIGNEHVTDITPAPVR